MNNEPLVKRLMRSIGCGLLDFTALALVIVIMLWTIDLM